MLIPDGLIDDVADLLREVADVAILPRFRHLTDEDVSEKSAGELVTVADIEAERLLAARLSDLLPEALIYGEESSATNPISDVQVLNDHLVWTIDPLDGTRAFVSGNEQFGMMIALIQRGETVASWIYAPVAGWLATAERGAGARLDGVSVSVAEQRPLAAMRGAIETRMLPEPMRSVADAARPRFAATAACGSAAWDHTDVARGVLELTLYYRTLPWDHAPGCLLVEEAGGVALRYDGSRWRPFDGQMGLMTAISRETWRNARDALLPSFATSGSDIGGC